MTDLPIQSLDCGSGIKPRKSLDPRREHEEHGGGGRNNKKCGVTTGFTDESWILGGTVGASVSGSVGGCP